MQVLLVFFDDIMVYNKALELHIENADNSLKLFRDDQFFMKHSKGAFWAPRFEYPWLSPS